MKPTIHSYSEYNYLKNNYMSNNFNSNPFKFTYNQSTNKIRFDRPDAKDARVTDRQSGHYYIKCTYIVYFRSHDGYCSEVEDYDEVGYELETQKLVTLYFTIPEDLTDESGGFDESLLDAECNLANNDRTFNYFLKWSNEASCCGVCGYTDLYVPQYIEWIKVV